MESFLEKSAQAVEPHALPFRAIFEEHLRRNGVQLLAQAKLIFGWANPEEALRYEIVQQENAYQDLAAANLSISEGRCPSSSLDELTAKCEMHDDRLKRLLHAMNASALCLSGGGIRSASFSLGVLEGLSLFSGSQKGANGLMHNLDYLSTVSGGGYIGSWFISWVQQRRVAKDILPPTKALIQCIADCREKISSSNLKALQASAKKLVSAAQAIQQQARAIWPPYESFEDLIECINRQATALEEEADRLARKTANTQGLDEARREAESCWRLAGETLSAAISPFSTKAYTDGCIEAISAQAYSEVVAAMAGNQSVTSGDAEPRPVRHLRSYTSYLAPSMGFTLDTFTLAAIVLRNLLVNWVMVIPVLLTLISLAQITGFGTAHFQSQSSTWWPSILVWTISGGQLVLGGIVAVLFIVAALAAGFSLPSHHEKLNYSVRRWSVVVFVVMVVLASWLLTVSQGTISESSPFKPGLWLKAVICTVDFGVLAVSIWLAYKERIGQINLGRSRGRVGAGVMNVVATLLISLLTGWLLQLDRLYVYPILLSGGSSPFLQQLASDSRLFIVFALPITLAILMATTSLFCALLGIFEMEQDREWWVRCGGAFLIFNLVWILAHGIAFYGEDGWKTVVAGVSGLGLGLLGSLLGSSGATSAGPRPVKAAQLTSVGGFLEKHHMVLPSIGGLSLCLIALGIAAAEESIRKAMAHSLGGELASAAELFVIALVFSVLINFAININLFSLYGMYRMRLMRAFLGASNVFRRPDPFTNFDPNDTPYEADLPACHGVPLHVINTTLNLTGTKNTAWRQRRAESFTFSPIECGGWRVGYVKTECYGGTRGVTLATAMSISGAAFNPNMGYQSSPILSLLMTFFNLRLGCWLPNPKRPTPKMGMGSRDEVFFRKSGPTCALQPLIAEALGNTDDRYRWIELTDGGHFENLGLYEMVMRRCKNIIVVDAGADPLCQFEDLGNAIRKIRIDLGIPIVFSPPDMKMREGMRVNNSYCAVARIQYHCVDEVVLGKSAEELNGWLVYIKAGLTGEEPADILQYAKTHSTFPHETTGNQFFSESQFESYRHLGSYIIRCIVDAAPCPQPRIEERTTFSTFVKAAQNYWNSKGPMEMPEVIQTCHKSP